MPNAEQDLKAAGLALDGLSPSMVARAVGYRNADYARRGIERGKKLMGVENAVTPAELVERARRRLEHLAPAIRRGDIKAMAEARQQDALIARLTGLFEAGAQEPDDFARQSLLSLVATAQGLDLSSVEMDPPEDPDRRFTRTLTPDAAAD